MNLEIETPEWFEPFLAPKRYKGLKGGRGSAKSHAFAGLLVETSLLNPRFNIVCLREIQKSLKLSAKKLIEDKIEAYGVQDEFKILDTEIRRVDAQGNTTGLIIFQGMQDHTSDSIKSLEGFNIAWFEEAQRMSHRSLELLRPTIRGSLSEPTAEIWFSWNPDQVTDPIEKFLNPDPVEKSDRIEGYFCPNAPENAIVAHINYTDNPWLPEVLKEEAAIWQKNDPDTFAHVWLGAFNTKSDDQILNGRWEVDVFEVDPAWAGPYYGADWGFSTDPNAIVECYVDEKTNRLYIRRELYRHGVEIEDTPGFFAEMMGIHKYVIRADNARPELISYVKRTAPPGGQACRKIQPAEKWAGSVEDGISKLRSFARIVIHLVDAPKTAEECSLYKYKRDRLTDDILPDIIDKWNHCIDAIRYAIEELTKRTAASFFKVK